jgi:hypothetical protein
MSADEARSDDRLRAFPIAEIQMTRGRNLQHGTDFPVAEWDSTQVSFQKMHRRSALKFVISAFSGALDTQLGLHGENRGTDRGRFRRLLGSPDLPLPHPDPRHCHAAIPHGATGTVRQLAVGS